MWRYSVKFYPYSRYFKRRFSYVIKWSLKRPVPSMLTFPLQCNFPPLSMRITSCIVQKKQPMIKKLSAKRLNPRQLSFVRLMRSLINLWFPTNQIKETIKKPNKGGGKSTTVTWRCYNYGKEFKTVCYACTFLPAATTTGTITAATATTTTTTTTNKVAATT